MHLYLLHKNKAEIASVCVCAKEVREGKYITLRFLCDSDKELLL